MTKENEYRYALVRRRREEDSSSDSYAILGYSDVNRFTPREDLKRGDILYYVFADKIHNMTSEYSSVWFFGDGGLTRIEQRHNNIVKFWDSALEPSSMIIVAKNHGLHDLAMKAMLSVVSPILLRSPIELLNILKVLDLLAQGEVIVERGELQDIGKLDKIIESLRDKRSVFDYTYIKCVRKLIYSSSVMAEAETIRDVFAYALLCSNAGSDFTSSACEKIKEEFPLRSVLECIFKK